MLEELLKEISTTKLGQGVSKGYICNSLKEVLQIFVLNYIYNSPYGSGFIFTGGSCLRVCYGLPRLSEDLDFDLTSKVDDEVLANEIMSYFKSKLQFDLIEYTISGRCKRIYLKFPILKKLGISDQSETDKLYVKLEMTPSSSKNFKTELTPISKYNLAMIIKNYDLPTLFAGKINAVLQRTFFKGKKNEITFKGRDYYDLIWYLEKGIIPNWQRIFETTKLKTKKKVMNALNKKVKKINTRYLKEDLINLFEDTNFVENFCASFQELYKKYKTKLGLG